MVRVVIAGILGGVVVFMCGFVEHMYFGWTEPNGKLANETAFVESVKDFPPELYFFPGMPVGDRAQEKEAMDKLNERYKQGPSGLLLIMPTGEDMMPPWKLAYEGLSNIAYALIAAWIVSLLAPGTNFCTRWLVVLMIGVAAWLAIDASYGTWYRFPWQFIREGLFCAMFESGVAGLVIAALVKPRTT